ncbi:MAG: hypothetical protein IJ688_12075 [Treponema sp.]|nr:hypothetical protein [Treponema sp.]
MSVNFLFPDKTNFTPDMSETARYLGYRRTTPPDAEVSALMQKAASEMLAAMKPQAVFEIYDLSVVECRDNGVSKPPYEPTDQVVSIPPSDYSTTVTLRFADVTLHSRDLGRNLAGCSKVALLAATIGPQVDALIRRHSSLDPVYASILQATGAMFIEELVDLVNEEIKKIAAAEGLKTKPRYSPGFGDVPLQVQKDFFRLLPCTRIGLTLMDTLIMAPEKSVTAFVGIGG